VAVADSDDIKAAAAQAPSARTVAVIGVLPAGDHAIIVRRRLAVNPEKGRMSEDKRYRVNGPIRRAIF
jgi:hypothetical protein